MVAFEIENVGEIEFDETMLPIEGDYYCKTKKECILNNFMTKTINGHTIYLCSPDNSAGLYHYFDYFLLKGPYFRDFEWFLAPGYDFYYWVELEMADSSLSCVPSFNILVEELERAKKLLCVNGPSGSDIIAYALVDIEAYENISEEEQFYIELDRKMSDLFRKCVEERRDEEGISLKQYDFYKEVSDWAREIIDEVEDRYL